MLSETGKNNGHIAKRELPTLPVDLVYACQEKAWFDEGMMVKWIDEVLAPDLVNAPEVIVPILFLDSFSVHMKARVVNKIQDLGVQVEFIPPGCTGLLQPVDVGFNKAFKAKVRGEYNCWLLQQDHNLPIPATSRRLVADWIIAADKNVSENTRVNSWRKTGYSYFGVFRSNGDFEGDDAIVGDDPNQPDDFELGDGGDAIDGNGDVSFDLVSEDADVDEEADDNDDDGEIM